MDFSSCLTSVTNTNTGWPVRNFSYAPLIIRANRLDIADPCDPANRSIIRWHRS